MEDLKQEITQDIKAEKIIANFIKYFPHLLAIIAAFLLIFSIIMYFNHQQQIRNQQVTEKLHMLLQKEINDEEFYKSVEKINSKTKDLIYIAQGKEDSKIDLVRDLGALFDKDLNSHIFSLTQQEIKIANLIQEKKYKKALELINNLLEQKQIPSSLYNRMEQLNLILRSYE
jgi:hypothetical protein